MKRVVVVILLGLGAALLYWSGRPPKPLPVSLPDAAQSSNSINTASSVSSASAVSDYSTALDAALLETDPVKRSIAFSTAFARWFDADPNAALAYLKTMPRGNEYTQAMFAALQSIAKDDPQRALLLAQEMATTHEQKFIYSALFDHIAGISVDSAINDLDLVPAGEARQNALRALAAKWADRDVETLLKWAGGLADPDERAAAIETTLAVFAKRDPQQALALAGSYSEDLDSDALERVQADAIKQLTGINPQAAAEYVSQLPPGELQKNSAGQVARALASQDVDAALAWVQNLPNSDSKNVALINTLDIWAKQNAAEAAQFVANMPAGAEQDYAVAHLAENLAEKNPELAVQWIDSLSSDSARVNATISAASGWARQAPADATQWVASLPADSPGRADALNGALTYWVMADAAAAGKYVQALPETDQLSAIKAVAPTLSQNDPRTALDWAQAFSSSASRQVALREVLARWKQNQPDEAARWAQANQ